MKLLFITQVALGYNLKELFNLNFQNELANHGCHCARIAGNLDTAADSEPASATDGHCRDWQKARKCASFSDACRNYDSDYDSSISCASQVNTCAKLFCRLDTEFVARIRDSIPNIDNSVNPSCSYDKLAPKNHDGEACCLTDQFETEFYKYAEKSCNDGQVSSEPSPIFPEDLNQVAAELDSIPDLTFDHTDTWLGPEIATGLQDLNGALVDETEVENSTSQAPQRRKRAVVLPQNFDLRTDTACGSLTKTVRDQGACGTCYAFAVASTTSQALCVASKGASQKLHSPMDVANCYEPILGNKQNACKGGYATRGFDHFRDNGIVTGTNVLNTLGANTLGCFPYGMGGDSLSHFDLNQSMVPTCPSTCQRDFETRNFASDKQGKTSDIEVVRFYNDEQGVMEHIKEHGAVQASFTVYADFYLYKSRVYTQNSNVYKGDHAVSVIGWGVENGIKYWLCKNSWNARWGDGGFFKIRRGTNECGIEGNVMTGLKWRCPAGYSVNSEGKCVPGACSDTQYLKNGVCENCPMNGESTADRTGCLLRSYDSPARHIYFRSYNLDGTARLNWINFDGKLDRDYGDSVDTFQKHPWLISIARETGGRLDVFAGAPELIPGDDTVFYLINSDNEGSMVSDSGAYPPTTRQGSQITVKFSNNSGRTVLLYWIDASGSLQLYHSIPNKSERIIDVTYVSHRWAMKVENGEWFWTGSVSNENFFATNGKTRISVRPDLKVKKSGYQILGY